MQKEEKCKDLRGDFKRIAVCCDDEMEDVSRSSIHAASLIYTLSFANKVVVQWYNIIPVFLIEKQAYEPFDPIL